MQGHDAKGFGQARSLIKEYTADEISAILKATCNLFLKPLPWSADIAEMIAQMYFDNGRGVVSFDAGFFGSRILDPSYSQEECDIVDMLCEHGCYLTETHNSEEIKQYGLLNQLNEYNPKTQYLLGVYLTIRCVETGRDQISIATAVAPLLKQNNPVIYFDLN